jgi:hypothetical protein
VPESAAPDQTAALVPPVPMPRREVRVTIEIVDGDLVLQRGNAVVPLPSRLLANRLTGQSDPFPLALAARVNAETVVLLQRARDTGATDI